MVSTKIVINNEIGLHLRPTGILCREAMNFKSRISFKKEDTIANAKSIISVLGASVKHGDEIELICDGEDEEEALKSLTQVIQNGLGEKKGNQN